MTSPRDLYLRPSVLDEPPIVLVGLDAVHLTKGQAILWWRILSQYVEKEARKSTDDAG